MRSKGNTIIITGGSSGIGAELAVRLAKAGNRVIISGRRADRLAEVAARDPGILTRVCDIADEGQRADLVSWLAKAHPETNVFVNNAGVQMSGNFMTGLDPTKMRAEIETNRSRHRTRPRSPRRGPDSRGEPWRHAGEGVHRPSYEGFRGGTTGDRRRRSRRPPRQWGEGLRGDEQRALTPRGGERS